MTTTTNPAETGVIEVTSLRKEFPTANGVFAAVDGINLRTEPGEFVTLLGPSGCGKTTTLRMIAGFETPTSGSITLDGADMLRLTPDKRPMAMVFQSYALFPHMSVADNVSYGLRLRKTPAAEMKKQVEAALESMGLSSLGHRPPNQLSGGQQQRVALARAMVMRPKVLLFDEPLSNLDAKLRVAMRAEIRRLQQEMGITALYVTHDQDEAMSLSDRIIVMNKGRIEQMGNPEQIYRHPATAFVADFIGQANFLDATVSSISDGVARVTVLGGERSIPAADEVTGAGESTILVRPESVEITRESGDQTVGGNYGTVLSTVFYGAVVEYVVRTESGDVTAVVSDPDAADIAQPGEIVRVDFPTDRGWVLRKADRDEQGEIKAS